MLKFFSKSQPRHPTTELAQALASDGLPPGMDPATLEVLEQHGSYSGRQVTYFRVFDPQRAAERALQIRRYADLDVHADLVLGSGHFERGGAVVLSRQQRAPSTRTFGRTQADRSQHTEDEQVVFPDRRS
jgi:hypothetical protein